LPVAACSFHSSAVLFLPVRGIPIISNDVDKHHFMAKVVRDNAGFPGRFGAIGVFTIGYFSIGHAPRRISHAPALDTIGVRSSGW